MQIMSKRIYKAGKTPHTIVAEGEPHLIVSSHPDCIGGIYISRRSLDNKRDYHVRLSPDEIEAIYKLFKQRGAG